MPPRKGARNAEAYQKSIVAETTKKIDSILREQARTGVVFQNITALSEFLAPLVNRSGNRLRRHLVYRILLEQHLSLQRGAASLISAKDRNVNILKARGIRLELEVSNLRQDNVRLSTLITRHLPGIGGDSSIPTEVALSKIENARAPEHYRMAFESTADLLAKILERMANEGWEVDMERGGLFDRSARPGQQELASATQTKWFIEWLKSESKKIK